MTSSGFQMKHLKEPAARFRPIFQSPYRQFILSMPICMASQFGGAARSLCRNGLRGHKQRNFMLENDSSSVTILL
jgi:hypothetical protein